MSCACTPVFVGVTTPVSEIWLPFKNGQISLWGIHDHGKNLIDWNQLKTFMQVEIDVTCIYTNFGGRDFSGFGDIATFKNGQISLLGHGLYSMVIEKFKRSESAQKNSCK